MQARQSQGNQDNAYDFLWIIALAIGVVFFSWYFGRFYIAEFIYKTRLFEIDIIQNVLGYWNSFSAKWHLSVVSTDRLQQWADAIRTNRLDINIVSLQAICTEVGRYLRYPVAFILAILAVIIYSKNVTLKFKTIFTMKNMRSMEQYNWPQITPILNINLVKQDIDKGPWAMAMSPMQFCKKLNLLKEKVNETGRPEAELLRGAAQQVFVLQLGSLWNGNPQSLPIHMQALFAVFAACANEDRKQAVKLLKQISSSSIHGKLNFEGAKELLVKHYNSKLVVKVLQRHAYVYSVMASMLELARTDGVLATSDFLWLKPLDRKLWYMLNSVGRQTSVPEISGPFAHWVAERKWGGALRTPMVEEAVKGLEIALSEIIYEPDEN